ncbi:MAG: 4a-hydroxytetrahydrobiopterin dehydratase [Bacteroidota bacterium]|nr:4a-hydroxytetrahydrobiopterin dehydratase [Bacteroidota bacterium]MDP4205850.1 4a-hydroxytetrahydrobiopterin dehydratase [Bacteroidota bacterium]
MEALSEQEIAKFLALHLKEWGFEKNTIKRDFKFKTFVEAFSFMTAIALVAEKMNHHPDWSNSYIKVSIVLTTHEANGVTQLDFDLANTIDRLYKNYICDETTSC